MLCCSSLLASACSVFLIVVVTVVLDCGVRFVIFLSLLSFNLAKRAQIRSQGLQEASLG